MSYADLARIEVEGVDGSTWVLNGPGAGREGVHLGESLDGIYDAPVRTLWQQGAFQEGATANGARWDARDVVFTAMIQGVSGRSWQDVDSQWRRAWSYTADSIMRVTTESGTRELWLRMFESPKFTPDVDPRVNEFGEVVMTCRAGDPFWYERPDKQHVHAATPSGTVYRTVVNPTDKDMWLRFATTPGARWTIPDFDFKGSTRTLTLPTAYTNHRVEINTHQLEEQVVIKEWANAWEAMDGKRWINYVPAYTPPTDIPFSWSGSDGNAGLVMEQNRRWSRPWGLE